MENSNSAIALLKERLRNYKLYPNPFAVREQELAQELRLQQTDEEKHCNDRENSESEIYGKHEEFEAGFKFENEFYEKECLSVVKAGCATSGQIIGLEAYWGEEEDGYQIENENEDENDGEGAHIMMLEVDLKGLMSFAAIIRDRKWANIYPPKTWFRERLGGKNGQNDEEWEMENGKIW